MYVFEKISCCSCKTVSAYRHSYGRNIKTGKDQHQPGIIRSYNQEKCLNYEYSIQIIRSNTYIMIHIHTCMHTYIHTCMHAYMDIYIYLPTYLPIYLSILKRNIHREAIIFIFDKTILVLVSCTAHRERAGFCSSR